MTTSLPTPSAEALQHSERVAALLSGEIAAQGGWLPFSRFMDLALYAPGLGYYSAGLHKFGSTGDFVTAPEISPLFGRTLARQVAQILAVTAGDILEVGAGSGRLALDLLLELEALGTLPRRYLILEVSADLRQRPRLLLEERAPQLAGRVSWLDALPASFNGVILGNEALDAMPVELVAWRDRKVFQRGVAWENEAFAWRDRELGEGDLYRRATQLPPARFGIDYVSEIAPAVEGFIASLAACLKKGAMLFIDYGFGESEYYHPQRDAGTLMCHYRHHAHADPLILPGLQDITAHVDFSAVARSGAEAGLELLGYASQAHFLLNCGLTDLLGRVSPEDASAYLPLAAQAQKLVSPAEMVELFKVIALGKGLVEPLAGFVRGDKRHAL